MDKQRKSNLQKDDAFPHPKESLAPIVESTVTWVDIARVERDSTAAERRLAFEKLEPFSLRP